MAIDYNDFKVLEVIPESGQVTVAWYDANSATPIPQQNTLIRTHKVPLEAETNNWTREQLRAFWELEVEDVADIPAWADNEVGQFFVISGVRLRQTQP